MSDVGGRRTSNKRRRDRENNLVVGGMISKTIMRERNTGKMLDPERKKGLKLTKVEN